MGFARRVSLSNYLLYNNYREKTIMSKQFSPLEKEFLVKRFLSNPSIKLSDFARINGISDTSLRKWVEIYKNEGIEGFTRGNKELQILPDGLEGNEENYKREIIKIKIELERLKKNYTVTQNPDGTTTYKHLKEKNTQ